MKIQLGKYQKLTIRRLVDFGAYVGPADSDEEVLLPGKYMPENAAPGDEIEVFVYNDSDDRPVAVTERPYAIVGEFAFLEVNAVNDTGAFMDWGLPKDLLVPYSEQRVKMRRGGIYLVYI
ncbi:MAG: GntR family transcriptional regulator, partial [Muribaculaceae bacterium]|nr:GntR family transcriptional regulator [Muribaculaceae bacterium]